MPFRYDEARQAGLEKAQRYLLPASLSPEKRKEGRVELDRIVAEYGPVVSGYPIWHPLVSNHEPRRVTSHPGPDCGYRGLDHTLCFANAFVTCPYDDGTSVVESVHEVSSTLSGAYLGAEILDVSFYSERTTSVLVTAHYRDDLEPNNMIPKKLAVPLMLLRELRDWPGAQVGETWETMRPYLLGAPHGNRSSMFVSQDTAIAMKKAHNLLNETGMFGPVFEG